MFNLGMENNNSTLHAVFSKLSGVLPIKPQELGPTKTMTSEIIETVLADSPVPPVKNYQYDLFSTGDDRGICLTIPSLTYRLEYELRAAKRNHLSCGEVLLPCGLLYRISRDVLSMAESEPCGIRGCLIHLNFELVDECRKLSTFKCDPSTPTTFELNLILKQGVPRWNFIPQVIKYFGIGSTIVLSTAYTLSKKKLYRSILE